MIEPSIEAAIQGAGAAVLSFTSAGLLPRLVRPPMATNHRGAAVPVSLGMAVAFAFAVTLLATQAGTAMRARPVGAAPFWLAGLLLAVFSAGLVDDSQQVRIRGVRTHLTELARGHVTSGIVKLAVIVVSALVWTLAVHSPWPRVVLGVPVIAGTANVWNLLDVAPGRALKFGLLAGVALVAVEALGLPAMVIGVCLALLPADVRERAMLGDSGANVLGFAIGVALFDRLPDVGLAVALAVVLVLHVVADTVTFTRIIRATPPLRWFDDLGRIRRRDPSVT